MGDVQPRNLQPPTWTTDNPLALDALPTLRTDSPLALDALPTLRTDSPLALDVQPRNLQPPTWTTDLLTFMIVWIIWASAPIFKSIASIGGLTHEIHTIKS